MRPYRRLGPTGVGYCMPTLTGGVRSGKGAEGRCHRAHGGVPVELSFMDRNRILSSYLYGNEVRTRRILSGHFARWYIEKARYDPSDVAFHLTRRGAANTLADGPEVPQRVIQREHSIDGSCQSHPRCEPAIIQRTRAC